MLVYTVANQKGGVGKTTTVISLAGLLIELGYRVLLIDTDPHASLTTYLQYDSDQLPASLYDLFKAPVATKEQLKKTILPTEIDQLSLIPASMALATLDRELGNKQGMGLFLKKQLTLVENEFDFVLIDCPPVLGVMMVNALATCDRVLVPVQTEYLAVKGLDRMIKTLQIMQKGRAKEFNFLIIPTMFDQRTKASVKTLKLLNETYANHVCQNVIPIDTKFRDASSLHLPISYYNSQCRGAQGYARLLDSLIKEGVQ